MGYTHYWYRPQKLDKDDFKIFIRLVKKILAKTTVPLEGTQGNEPKVTDDNIIINGIGDDGHETFHIGRTFHGHSFDEDESRRYAFCKTARKPYDEVVCALLIAFKRAFADKVEVLSDGGREGILKGQRLYEEATEIDMPNLLYGKTDRETKTEGTND